MMFHMRLFNLVRARLFGLLFGARFGSFGKGVRVVNPIAIEGAENIHLEKNVYVAAQSCLAARALTGADSCVLRVGAGSQIGRFNHIYATRRIVLGEKVLTANGVYISDNLHEYHDPHVAILDQPVRQNGEVEIGAGTWIGHNACILGVKIGRHCVVGANSVVTRDIPDLSIAVGSPAVIIKRYDLETGVWRPTHADGRFVDA